MVIWWECFLVSIRWAPQLRLVKSRPHFGGWHIKTNWWFGTFRLFFSYLGNFISPTDEIIFFRGVGIPPTSKECHFDTGLFSHFSVILSVLEEHMWNMCENDPHLISIPGESQHLQGRECIEPFAWRCSGTCLARWWRCICHDQLRSRDNSCFLQFWKFSLDDLRWKHINVYLNVIIQYFSWI